MRKVKFSIVVAAVLGMVSITSCKKCMECHAEAPGGEIDLGEYCGKAIEDVEANGYTDSTGTHDVHCGGH